MDILSIITEQSKLSNKKNTNILMKYIDKNKILKDTILLNYQQINKYDKVILVKKSNLKVYKYGIIIAKYNRYISMYINNSYTLTLNSSDYHIFRKENTKRMKYIQLLDHLSNLS